MANKTFCKVDNSISISIQFEEVYSKIHNVTYLVNVNFSELAPFKCIHNLFITRQIFNFIKFSRKIVKNQRKRKVLQSFHYLIEFIDAKIREIITVINLTFGKALPHKVAVCTNWPFKQTSLLYYLHNRMKYFLMQHSFF